MQSAAGFIWSNLDFNVQCPRTQHIVRILNCQSFGWILFEKENKKKLYLQISFFFRFFFYVWGCPRIVFINSLPFYVARNPNLYFKSDLVWSSYSGKRGQGNFNHFSNGTHKRVIERKGPPFITNCKLLLGAQDFINKSCSCSFVGFFFPFLLLHKCLRARGILECLLNTIPDPIWWNTK